MALSIKSDEADALARQLAELTGETLTRAVEVALRERLDRQRTTSRSGLVDRLEHLARDVSNLPVLDHRTADEILGYDRHGLPA
jgi:antitoxin VapB